MTDARLPALELQRHRHALRLRPGPRPDRLPVGQGEVVGAARRQRRRQVHAAQGDVRRAPARPAARSGCTATETVFHAPSDATAGRDPDGLPGPRPGRRRRTSRPTSTSAARSCARVRSAGSASSTTRPSASAPRPSSTQLGVRTAAMTRPVEMLSGGQRQVVALARSATRVVRRPQRRPAARRAHRRARLRADPAGAGADPADGRAGHRHRAGHPQPAAGDGGLRPDRRAQPRPQGGRHRPPPRPTTTSSSAGSPAPAPSMFG